MTKEIRMSLLRERFALKASSCKNEAEAEAMFGGLQRKFCCLGLTAALTSKTLQCCMDTIGRFVKNAISQADGDQTEWDKDVLYQLRLVLMFAQPPVGALQAWEPPMLREALKLKDSQEAFPSLFSKFPTHGQGMIQVLEARLQLFEGVEAWSQQMQKTAPAWKQVVEASNTWAIAAEPSLVQKTIVSIADLYKDYHDASQDHKAFLAHACPDIAADLVALEASTINACLHVLVFLWVAAMEAVFSGRQYSDSESEVMTSCKASLDALLPMARAAKAGTS